MTKRVEIASYLQHPQVRVTLEDGTTVSALIRNNEDAIDALSRVAKYWADEELRASRAASRYQEGLTLAMLELLGKGDAE